MFAEVRVTYCTECLLTEEGEAWVCSQDMTNLHSSFIRVLGTDKSGPYHHSLHKKDFFLLVLLKSEINLTYIIYYELYHDI